MKRGLDCEQKLHSIIRKPDLENKLLREKLKSC
jgi:hypothetical protein